jgi:hypothetical protein
MAYINQIKILESKLNQLKKGPFNTENLQKTFEIESAIRRIKRLEWEENYERIHMEEDR